MKYINKIKIGALILCFFIGVVGCADLEVENLNEPNREQALSEASDILSLLSGATLDVMWDQHDMTNIHIGLMTDQSTNTNNANDFWAYSDQPRRSLQNSTINSNLFVFDRPWSDNNSAISTANLIISLIQDGMVLENSDGVDKTQEALMGAYFIRGIAMGAIGTLFERGYVVDEKTDLTTLELLPSSEVIDAAVASLELAMGVIGQSNVDWEFFPTGEVFEGNRFKRIINSYIARFLISKAKTPEEAQTLDYARIKQFAQNGITQDFAPYGKTEVIYAQDLDWTHYSVSSGGRYINTDQKIAWFFDDSQPKDYPASGTLPPVTTNDKRAELYYDYFEDLGYLDAERNRSLFSNYGLNRWYGYGNNEDYDNALIPYILKSEMDYIIAECEFMQGNRSAALAIINNGPRSTVGELSPVTDDSPESIRHLLHYEYSIELDYTGKGIQWAFMRRHGLLQRGTPRHFPVPATELELVGEALYNFGGEQNIDGLNTSDGNGSWK
ncbi:hypothetical protein [Xanthovirga aplysinae]|uniref:hypothetical protein n=1 Tax=Xanthovirga aplysinae TaxID=2529853 RepID=UPI0012BC745F|nr:hypothetical protein [Xanthovirga aplysinae]MTI31306.1 hypothetical protein [Xanthovirga aplysinae]